MCSDCGKKAERRGKGRRGEEGEGKGEEEGRKMSSANSLPESKDTMAEVRGWSEKALERCKVHIDENKGPIVWLPNWFCHILSRKQVFVICIQRQEQRRKRSQHA